MCFFQVTFRKYPFSLPFVDSTGSPTGVSIVTDEHERDRRKRATIACQAELLGQHPEINGNEVATKLGLSPSLARRFLNEALKEGVFRTIYTPALEESVKSDLERVVGQLGLRHLRSIHCVHHGQTAVAASAARLFELIIEEWPTEGVDPLLVLDGGNTVASFVSQIARVGSRPLNVAAICTDPPSYSVSAFELMTQLVYRFRGRSLKLPYGKLNTRLSLLLEDVQQKARSACFVALGVGPWEEGNTALDFVEHLGEDPTTLRASNKSITSVGGYCCLTQEGVYVPTVDGICKMHRALSFEDLQEMSVRSNCTVAMLASGIKKARPLAAAILSRMCNTVILDIEAARELIKELTSASIAKLSAEV